MRISTNGLADVQESSHQADRETGCAFTLSNYP